MITFQLHHGNGEPSPKPSNTVYLGTEVDDRGIQISYLEDRFAVCSRQSREMRVLCYGLYRSCLIETRIDATDSGYVNSLRRVANIKPGFINHCSNHKIDFKTEIVPMLQIWKHKATT